MDWIKINERPPNDGEVVWVDDKGDWIQASYENGVFTDVIGNQLQNIQRWATLHVVY